MSKQLGTMVRATPAEEALAEETMSLVSLAISDKPMAVVMEILAQAAAQCILRCEQHGGSRSALSLFNMRVRDLVEQYRREGGIRADH